MYLEFTLAGGLFYRKMPDSKIFIWPPLEQHVWGTLVAQDDLNSKVAYNKMFFEFFLGGFFVCKNAQFENLALKQA